jgi:hypothetical protein
MLALGIPALILAVLAIPAIALVALLIDLR